MIQPESNLTSVPWYSCAVRQRAWLKGSWVTGGYWVLWDTDFIYGRKQQGKAHLFVVLRQHQNTRVCQQYDTLTRHMIAIKKGKTGMKLSFWNFLLSTTTSSTSFSLLFTNLQHDQHIKKLNDFLLREKRFFCLSLLKQFYSLEH